MPIMYIVILVIVALIIIFLYFIEPLITRQKIKNKWPRNTNDMAWRI